MWSSYFYKTACWLLDWSTSQFIEHKNKDRITIFAQHANLWDLTFFFIQYFASNMPYKLEIQNGNSVVNIVANDYPTTVRLITSLPFAGTVVEQRQKIDYYMVCDYNPSVRSILVGKYQEILHAKSTLSWFSMWVRLDMVRLACLYFMVCCKLNPIKAAVYLCLSKTSLSNSFFAMACSVFEPTFQSFAVWSCLSLALRCASNNKHKQALLIGLCTQLYLFGVVS